MKTILEKQIAGMGVTVMVPERAFDSVLYVHPASSNATLDGHQLSCAVVQLYGVDWNRELSPWPAKRAFKGGEDFSGMADRHIATLTDVVIPQVEGKLCSLVKRDVSFNRIIAGYSLAGLFAVYSLFCTDAFCKAVSGSGSFWFDGFTDFVRNNSLKSSSPEVYLSLGECESVSRNARLAAVLDCTNAVKRLLEEKGANVFFEMNSGGHFEDEAERMMKGYSRIGL
ncbi:MAG: hypothetical protein SO135_04140 [Sphaerochaetaceae bacterium]|nr:hypothetical protein [Sphaerochaetaceae bacterium]